MGTRHVAFVEEAQNSLSLPWNGRDGMDVQSFIPVENAWEISEMILTVLVIINVSIETEQIFLFMAVLDLEFGIQIIATTTIPQLSHS